MRNIPAASVWVIMLSVVMAVSFGYADDDCFTQLSNDKLVGDSLTVVTDDNSVIRGSRPIVNIRSSILYMKLASDTGLVGDALIPFETVNTISYRKPSPIRFLIVGLGFGVGMVGGGLAGGTLASDSDGLSAVGEAAGAAMVGAFVGALIGAGLGYEISKNVTLEVRLDCR